MKLFLHTALVVLACGQARADWTSGEDVARAAGALTERTKAFHELVQDRTGFSHLAEDAACFSRQARRFHGLVERQASYRDARRDFDELQRSFAQLKVAFARADDTTPSKPAEEAWRRIDLAFEALQHEMGIAHAEWHPSRHPSRPHR